MAGHDTERRAGPLPKGRGRGESRTSKRRMRALEKEEIAVNMRAAGYTLGEIAKKLGYASASGASDAIDRCIRDTRQANAEHYINLQLVRLDEALIPLFELMQNPRLGAVGASQVANAVVNIENRRAKLLGLDRPTTLNVNSAERYIEDLARENGVPPEMLMQAMAQELAKLDNQPAAE